MNIILNSCIVNCKAISLIIIFKAGRILLIKRIQNNFVFFMFPKNHGQCIVPFLLIVIMMCYLCGSSRGLSIELSLPITVFTSPMLWTQRAVHSVAIILKLLNTCFVTVISLLLIGTTCITSL